MRWKTLPTTGPALTAAAVVSAAPFLFFAAFLSLAAFLFLAAAPPAMAHHGWSGNEDEIEVSGVVETALSLSGPHGTMEIRDPEGRLWRITLAPAPRTHRAGLREGVVPEGAQVTVHGARNADAGVDEIKVRRVTYDGTHFDVYPPPRG